MLSALATCSRRGFGRIVLITVVVASVHYAKKISKRGGFLLPEVSLSDSGAAACGFDLQGREGVGWIEGRVEGKAEIHSLPGDCFWSLVQVPCCRRPLSSCCDAV